MKNKITEKRKFYHTSGTKYSVGDVIGGPGKLVYLHIKPIPHGTISPMVDAGFGSWKEYSEHYSIDNELYWDERIKWNDLSEEDKLTIPKPEYTNPKNPKKQKIWVYEMKPFKKEPTFGSANDEYFTDDFVEIVRIVGNAKGIMDNFKRKFDNNVTKIHHFGGKSYRP